LTLLEVILATAVFALSLVWIGQLLNQSSDQAIEVQQKSRGARLAQSKLAEYVAGVRSLSSGGEGDFSDEGEPDWNYVATSEADNSAAGLYKVTITASKGDVKTSLSQWVFDPKLKGSILAAQPPPTTATTDQSAPATTSTTATTPATTTPAAATKPATTTTPAASTKPGTSSKTGGGS
jgi:type II secretory pathway pseudopilin PulG